MTMRDQTSKMRLLDDQETHNYILINTKTKYSLAAILDDLTLKYLQAYNTHKDTTKIEQKFSNICYKLEESGTFLKIKIQCHLVRGEPYFIILFEDISIQRMYEKQ